MDLFDIQVLIKSWTRALDCIFFSKCRTSGLKVDYSSGNMKLLIRLALYIMSWRYSESCRSICRTIIWRLPGCFRNNSQVPWQWQFDIARCRRYHSAAWGSSFWLHVAKLILPSTYKVVFYRDGSFYWILAFLFPYLTKQWPLSFSTFKQ